LIGQFCLFLRRTLKKTQRTDLIIPDQGLNQGDVIGALIRMSADHKQLPDALILTKRIEDGIHPTVFRRIAAGNQLETLLPIHGQYG
jgi:hypothetical protein